MSLKLTPLMHKTAGDMGLTVALGSNGHLNVYLADDASRYVEVTPDFNSASEGFGDRVLAPAKSTLQAKAKRAAPT